MAANGLSQIMNFPELKMQVLRQLKRDLAKAESYFNRSFDLPEISYALKGKKAGVAYLQTNQIRFNPVLLQENGEQFIRQVVPHELAHLLVFQLFGRVQPHGKEWKMMMEAVLGVAAETYHCFDVASVEKQFTYQCDCQIHQLSIRRHNAILKGQRTYLCRQCRQSLRFVSSSLSES